MLGLGFSWSGHAGWKLCIVVLSLLSLLMIAWVGWHDLLALGGWPPWLALCWVMAMLKPQTALVRILPGSISSAISNHSDLRPWLFARAISDLMLIGHILMSCVATSSRMPIAGPIRKLFSYCTESMAFPALCAAIHGASVKPQADVKIAVALLID